MKQALVQILTIDGKMYSVNDDMNAQALFFECMNKKGDNALLRIETETKIRFIPLHQIKEIIFHDHQEESDD